MLTGIKMIESSCSAILETTRMELVGADWKQQESRMDELFLFPVGELLNHTADGRSHSN